MPLIQRQTVAHLLCAAGILFLVGCSLLTRPVPAGAGQNPFDPLRQRLIRDGFDRIWVEKLYSAPEVDFDAPGLAVYFRHRESRVNYDQFLTESQIRKARSYMEEYATELGAAEKTYGVDRTVITAIILVETQLGTMVGKRSVINTLSTLSALDDPDVRQTQWRKLSGNARPSENDFEAWSKRKADWAYRELKAFLTYARHEKIEPAGVYGSFAGAMGISQFMPTSIRDYAKDGNGDGRIDLFNHADAIASVAHYLKRHGMHPGADHDTAFKAVYRYNPSKYYVNTILKVSEKLKG